MNSQFYMKTNAMNEEYESPYLYCLLSEREEIICESYDAEELDFGNGGEW